MAFDLDSDPEWDKHRSSVEDIVATLERLRERRVDSVTAAGPPIKPKIVWKIEAYLQGQLYRSVALGDGVCDAWDRENPLVAVILARSIFETAAAVWAFKSSLEKAVQKKSMDAIDTTTNKYTFHSRWKGWEGDLSAPAPSILTFIDKLDAEFLGDPKGKHARDSYEFLSEFSHPNWPGAAGLFGEIDTEKIRMDFNPMHPKKWTIAHIISGAGTLRLVEHCLDKVEEMLLKIQEISESDS